jgi:hypothetical protein
MTSELCAACLESWCRQHGCQLLHPSHPSFGRIERYEHHGRVVAVDASLKGTHRDHCLCMRCTKLKAGDSANNCPIAQATYENCVRFGTVTPMYECPEFEAKEGGK